MKYRYICVALLILTAMAARAQSTVEQAEKHSPSKTQTIKLGHIPALTTLVPHTTPPADHVGKSWKRPNEFFKNEIRNSNALPQNGDPLAAGSKNTQADQGVTEISLVHNFDGLKDQDGVSPPDPTGDIGANHYVQMVNSGSGARFQIWNKQGQSVYGPANTSTIWDQVNSGSIGDPIIQFDHSAGRWLMLEMQGFSDNQLLIAVSDTDDPTGSWQAWRINCQGFPDYPKLYVWDNAYFVTVNEIVNGNVCTGYALNKQDILQGAAEVATYRFAMPNFQAIQYQPATGADWEGGPPPPPGSPGLIFRLYDDAWDGGSDQIHLWQINVNWETPSENFAFGPTKFDVAPFETRVCHGFGLFDCIDQPNTNVRITALENIIMYRAPYRNFGTHESVVFNHVTDVSNQVGDGGDAAVRWYEFRRDAGASNWYVYQQGTYAPDADNRFTGTISTDIQGNIGLGYTAASTITHPSVRVTGRRAGDPLGQMPVTEFNLKTGTFSNVEDSRWGDYSSMAVDPVDGKTFWFTSQYQTNSSQWGTRIGAFQIRRDTFDVSPIEIVSPQNAATLNNVQVTVKLKNTGLQPATNLSAKLFVDNTLLATESITGTIATDQESSHTFQPLLTWINFNDTKKITVVTQWAQDQFVRNDTITQTIKKLTSFDAAYGGMASLPNLICTSDYEVGLVLRNASGIPMDSAQIRWKLNQSPFIFEKWYGHLLPGQSDTVFIQLNGLNLPQNLFTGQILLPNGQPDQDSTNNKFNQKLYTNLSGSYLTVDCDTDLGNLRFELRDGSTNDLIDQGLCTAGKFLRDICVVDGNCYQLLLKSTTFKWEGTFQLKDLYGNPLHTQIVASPLAVVLNLCAPVRKAKDVGAWALLSPVSSEGLSGSEPVTIAVKNFGTQPASNIDVKWRMDGGPWNTEVMAEEIAPGAIKSFDFATVANLSEPGKAYMFDLEASIVNDEKNDNNPNQALVRHQVGRDIGFLNLLTNNICAVVENNYLELVVTNEGTSPIDSLTLRTTLNGTPLAPEVMYLGGLLPGDTTRQYVYLSTSNPGNNTAVVELLNLNGLPTDEYTGNNSISTTYFIDVTRTWVSISMNFDDKPQETSWELYYSGGQLIDKGGNYTPNVLYDFKNYCINKDSCLRFVLKDVNGSNGFFNITLDNINAAWSYNGAIDTFSNTLVVPFCANELCIGFDLATSITKPNNASLNNGVIAASTIGGLPPFVFSINGGAPTSNGIFSGLVPGIYLIKVRDNNDCITEELIVLDASSNTNDILINRQILVAPNPTTGPLWIEVPALPREQTLYCQLLDANGKQLRQLPLGRFDNLFKGSLGIQYYPAGTYWVVILDNNGRKIAEKRIQKF